MPEKPWNDMTSDEKASYNSVYLNNWDTIHDAIVLHKIRLRSTDITPGEEAEIDAQLLSLTFQLATLEAKYQARTRPGVVIEPPTPAQVAAAQSMAEESDHLIAEQQQVQRAFQLAEAAAALAQQIQAQPSASGT